MSTVAIETACLTSQAELRPGLGNIFCIRALKKKDLILIVCIREWGICTREYSAHGVQKKALNPLRLELQTAVSYPAWALETGLWGLYKSSTLSEPWSHLPSPVCLDYHKDHKSRT